MYKWVWSMEKIHGSSGHVAWNPVTKELTFFLGGAKHEEFLKCFDIPALTAKFAEQFPEMPVTVFGEGYGGKMQGMSATYGKQLKFIAFDVRMGEHTWLSVPDAEKVATDLGFEFVFYAKTPTDLESLDRLRDQMSVQAVRNGCGDDKKAEGIVLRPPFEVRKNNGARICAKHKRTDFQETKTPRVVGDKLVVLEAAEAVASEWVTEMRLSHVLGKMLNPQMSDIPLITKTMVEDVLREGEGEIVDSKEARRAISTRTVLLFKQRLQNQLKEASDAIV